MNYQLYKGPIISLFGGLLAVSGGMILYFGMGSLAALFGFIGFICVCFGIYITIKTDHKKQYNELHKQAKQPWE